MPRRPTIIDVAKSAEVSKSTVSLVLRRSPAVREETRVQVLEAMSRIGYVYNRTAANLRVSNADLVGLVINDLRNPFFTEFAISLQMALSERGYTAVVANTDENPHLQESVIGAMIEHGVCALIVSPAYRDDGIAARSFERAGIPTMQVLRKIHPDVARFPFAAPDYLGGGHIAVDHLLARGVNRIAFVGGLENREVTQERMAGYLSVLSKNGQEPLVFTGSASRQFGRQIVRKLVVEHPGIDAAICFNDLVALGMLAGCTEFGLDIGREFSIIGFDDIGECAETFPTLSSVRCDIAGFGEMIATMIHGWIETGIQPQPEVRTPVHLVVRDSSRLLRK